MSLYDGYTERQDEEKRKKVKKIILIGIIITVLLICLLIGLIMYIAKQPKALSLTLDDKANSELLKLLDIKVDETGNMNIYVPIKKVAKYFGYDDANGNYMDASEDTNSCNVKTKEEVAIFTVDSDVIYKKDLTNPNASYETYKLSEKVFKATYTENNKQTEELYTNIEGLELAFNVSISYDQKNNILKLQTLDYLIAYYSTNITKNETTGEEYTKIQKFGYSELDSNFVNQKAIVDGMLVVKDEMGTYGVITLNGEKIFSTRYESLTYIPVNEAFLVQRNGKYGISSVSGENKTNPKTLIDTVYDSLELIDSEKQLYLVSNNTRYGVIDINNNPIIPLDYEKIGIDNITEFASNNITNRYIIQDTLIPVQQDGKWGFYDVNGKKITECVYETVGCITTSGQGTASPVVSIPEYDSIVVSKINKNGKIVYGCINLKGEVSLDFDHETDYIYMQTLSGVTKYIMCKVLEEGKVKQLDVAEYIIK